MFAAHPTGPFVLNTSLPGLVSASVSICGGLPVWADKEKSKNASLFSDKQWIAMENWWRFYLPEKFSTELFLKGAIGELAKHGGETSELLLQQTYVFHGACDHPSVGKRCDVIIAMHEPRCVLPYIVQ